MFKNKILLITGGTGSFGKIALEHAVRLKFKKIIVFSRDELKQYEMRQTFKSRVNDFEYAFDTDVPPKEFFIKNKGHNKEIFSIGDLAPESIR